VTPVEFRGDLWHQKTRVPVLSCGVVCVILRLAVLVEHRLVTDRHRHRERDGQRPMASRGLPRMHIASRGNNRFTFYIVVTFFDIISRFLKYIFERYIIKTLVQI